MRYLRSKDINPLIFPFLLTNFAYGMGFVFLQPFDLGGRSSAYYAMEDVGKIFPILWGVLVLVNILLAAWYLSPHSMRPGRAIGTVGFALWLFVSISYAISGDWIAMFGVSIPNMWFWAWQYFDVSCPKDSF